MSDPIVISGSGAVSPAGWGIEALTGALQSGAPLPATPFEGAPRAQRRAVPKPAEKLPFLRNPRLRRASPVGRYLAAAASEALGERRPERLAIIVSCYTGSVNYSSRFYGEVLNDPSIASPIVFPETVFNAPSSHLSALLGSDEVNHTLVGDESAFVTALDLATCWIQDDRADAVLVAAGEESDPLTAEALALHQQSPTVGEGAAALLLERSTEPGVELVEITDPITYTKNTPRDAAIEQARAGTTDDPCARCVEILGDIFGATPALATVLAANTLKAGETATLPIIGKNQAAAQLRFTRHA